MIFRWYRFEEWLDSSEKSAYDRIAKKRERLKQWHFHFAWIPRGILLPVQDRLVAVWDPVTASHSTTKKEPARLMHVAWMTTIARRATYANSYKPNKKLYQYGPITNVVSQPK